MNYKYVINKNKVIIALGVAFIILCSAGIYIYNASRVSSEWGEAIYPSVKIENVDVGGKTKEEAKALIKEKYEKSAYNKEVTIQYLDSEKKLPFSDFSPEFNIDKAIEEAFNQGRESSFLKKYNYIKNGLSKEISMEYSYSEEKVNELTGNLAEEIKQEPVNAKITKGENFEITPEQNGQKLDEEKLKKDLNKALKSINSKEVVVKANLDIEEAKIKEEDLKTIDKQIGSFTTNFGTSVWGRAQNVQIGASKLNGSLVMPGEEFSFNEFVGEASKANGYQLATEYYGDEQRQGYGGGICQVSTTLYNALVRAGITITERNNHTQPVGYVNPSADAMISYGASDLKFVNTFDYPIYIQASAPNRTLTINVYSAAETKPDNIEYKLTYKLITDNADYKISEGYIQKIVDGQIVESNLVKKDTYKKYKPKEEEKKEEDKKEEEEKKEETPANNEQEKPPVVEEPTTPTEPTTPEDGNNTPSGEKQEGEA